MIGGPPIVDDCRAVRAEVQGHKASGTKSGKAFGRPRVAHDTDQRIREARATPGRPRFHKIAARFGVANRHGAADRDFNQRHMTRAALTEAIKPSQSRGPPSLRRA